MLCQHPSDPDRTGPKYWAGSEIIIKHNGHTIATMPAGFREFEHCLNIDDVDVTNDEFQLQSTSDDAVCITSLSINRNPLLVGKSNNLQNFWIDSNEPYCSDHFMSSSQITIRNGQVISSTCKGTAYTLGYLQLGLDLLTKNGNFAFAPKRPCSKNKEILVILRFTIFQICPAHQVINTLMLMENTAAEQTKRK